ncbi:MAG TPA: aspartate aminotransferase family protein [Candidatus Dormibacteraeota bacterium]
MATDPVYHKRWHRPYPVAVRAEGIYVYDESGKQYIDAIGGSYVVAVGHGVKEVTDAMHAQAEAVCFPYVGTFTTQAEVDLASLVVDMAPPGLNKVFFLSGGSEATEVAIKMARKYHLLKGQGSRWRVIGRWQSYHGATIGAMSAGGHVGRRGDFEPYLLDFPHIDSPYCYRCPWHKTYPGCGLLCAHDLELTIRQSGVDTIAAFICEPISGSALGALVPPPEYYRQIREICDKYDVLFIVDEVITGFGRTGANFAIQHYGVTPDLIVCGKGLGSGYMPLGAVIIHDKVAEAFEASDSALFTGYTYSGHPVACAAGVAVIRYLQQHELVERARTYGAWFLDRLSALRSHPSVGDIRGMGMLAGIEFVADAQTRRPFPPELRFGGRVVSQAWERGLVIASETGTVEGVAGDHVMLAPPLIATKIELTQIIEILDAAISQVESEVIGIPGELSG